MTAGPVRYENKDGVGIITVDNPPLNVLSRAVRDGRPGGPVREAAADSAASAVVLTGAGRTFMAGADITEFSSTFTGTDIAVLVILGILAAAAIPRYIDLQTSSQQYAVQGAVVALKSTVGLQYANALLTTPSTTVYAPTSPATVGDFTGTIANAAGVVTVTVNWPTKLVEY